MNNQAIHIAVAWLFDGTPQEATLVVRSGTTLAALRESAELRRVVPAEVVLSAAAIGVWSRVKPSTYVLRQQDRVELYAALKVDPKEQRRKRAR